MKYTTPFILILLVGSTLLFNCDCKRLCSSPAPVASFQGFDSVTLSAVILNQYNNNGQFNDLERTSIYTSRVFTAANPSFGDTMELGSLGIPLEYASDYTISVPALSRTWYLKNISMQPTKMNATQCTNGLNYILNDTLYVIPANPASANIPVFINIMR